MGDDLFGFLAAPIRIISKFRSSPTAGPYSLVFLFFSRGGL